MAKTRMRIAHVSQGLDTGGLEKLLVEFARHADRSRFDLRFITLGGRGRLASEVEACGWPVHALEKPPGRRPGTVVRLARRLRAWGVDVVHSHNNGPLIHAAPAAWLAGVPRFVHTRHHGLDPYPSRFESAGFRLASRLADRVVCVSDDGERLSRGEGLAPGKLRTIRNGIDTARLAYVGPAPGGPVVTVARLSPEKDIATLLGAAALAARIDPCFALEIAGDGECLPALERASHDLGLGDRVRFLGEVREVPDLLARASLFALPSLTEGISVTLLEAMARGLPVVATRVGGNPEVVVDGLTGLLVPPSDPAALAQGLLRLRCDSEMSRRMGEAGRCRVERLFEVRRMVADYESLYLDPARRSGPHAHPAGRTVARLRP